MPKNKTKAKRNMPKNGSRNNLKPPMPDTKLSNGMTLDLYTAIRNLRLYGIVLFGISLFFVLWSALSFFLYTEISLAIYGIVCFTIMSIIAISLTLNRAAFTGLSAVFSLIACCLSCATYFGLLTYGLYNIEYGNAWIITTGALAMMYVLLTFTGALCLTTVQKLVKMRVTDKGNMLSKNSVQDLTTEEDMNSIKERLDGYDEEAAISYDEDERLLPIAEVFDEEYEEEYKEDECFLPAAPINPYNSQQRYLDDDELALTSNAIDPPLLEDNTNNMYAAATAPTQNYVELMNNIDECHPQKSVSHSSFDQMFLVAALQPLPIEKDDKSLHDDMLSDDTGEVTAAEESISDVMMGLNDDIHDDLSDSTGEVTAVEQDITRALYLYDKTLVPSTSMEEQIIDMHAVFHDDDLSDVTGEVSAMEENIAHLLATDDGHNVPPPEEQIVNSLAATTALISDDESSNNDNEHNANSEIDDDDQSSDIGFATAAAIGAVAILASDSGSDSSVESSQNDTDLSNNNEEEDSNSGMNVAAAIGTVAMLASDSDSDSSLVSSQNDTDLNNNNEEEDSNSGMNATTAAAIGAAAILASDSDSDSSVTSNQNDADLNNGNEEEDSKSEMNTAPAAAAMCAVGAVDAVAILENDSDSDSSVVSIQNDTDLNNNNEEEGSISEMNTTTAAAMCAVGTVGAVEMLASDSDSDSSVALSQNDTDLDNTNEEKDSNSGMNATTASTVGAVTMVANDSDSDSSLASNQNDADLNNGNEEEDSNFGMNATTAAASCAVGAVEMLAGDSDGDSVASSQNNSDLMHAEEENSNPGIDTPTAVAASGAAVMLTGDSDTDSVALSKNPELKNTEESSPEIDAAMPSGETGELFIPTIQSDPEKEDCCAQEGDINSIDDGATASDGGKHDTDEVAGAEYETHDEKNSELSDAEERSEAVGAETLLPTEEEDSYAVLNQNDFELHSETINNEEVISIEDDQNSEIDELNEALIAPDEDAVSNVETGDENVANAMAPIALVPEEDANETEIVIDDFAPEIDPVVSNQNNELISNEEMEEETVFDAPDDSTAISDQFKEDGVDHVLNNDNSETSDIIQSMSDSVSDSNCDNECSDNDGSDQIAEDRNKPQKIIEPIDDASRNASAIVSNQIDDLEDSAEISCPSLQFQELDQSELNALNHKDNNATETNACPSTRKIPIDTNADAS